MRYSLIPVSSLSRKVRLLPLTDQEKLTALFLVGVIIVGHGIELLTKIFPPSRRALEIAQREVLYPHVDVNLAGVEELDAVPYISRSLAWKIVRFRREKGRFRKLDDLLQVDGAARFFSKIKRYLIVGDSAGRAPSAGAHLK
jgi:hypothetical protein